MVPFIPLAVSEVMIWGFYREPYIGFPSNGVLGLRPCPRFPQFSPSISCFLEVGHITYRS